MQFPMLEVAVLDARADAIAQTLAEKKVEDPRLLSNPLNNYKFTIW